CATRSTPFSWILCASDVRPQGCIIFAAVVFSARRATSIGPVDPRRYLQRFISALAHLDFLRGSWPTTRRRTVSHRAKLHPLTAPRMIRLPRLASPGIVAATLVAMACGGGSASRRITPEYDKKTGRLTLLKYDSNGDGRVDTWSYMDGARVVRIEIDKD